MNVLKPKIISVKNRCYRSLEAGSQHDSRKAPHADESCDESKISKESTEIKRAESCEEAEEECHIEIKELKDSRLLLVLEVPKCFRGLIFGSKRQTLNRITNATNTKIEIPAEHQDGPIKIFGDLRENVLSARRKILDIVNSARQRSDFTHFIAAYARDSNIQQTFKHFKNEVLSKHGNARGVTKEVFQDEHRLHLTFGILVLLGENERKEAESLLKRVIEEVVDKTTVSEKIKLRIQGLEYMNDDPSEVHVLYAKVQQIAGSIDFQMLANKIVKEFKKSKLMINVKTEEVKLHLTLMNSVFRTKDVTAYNSRKMRESFDATNILIDFNDYFFGEVEVNDIEILRHNSYDDRGYYKCTAKIPLKKVIAKPKGTSVRLVLDN
ncbi:activating signal cointegrator 1 complex subunit 1-like protein [Leptotrombidium deliense]|uniref:Activating signal cointegrator 1 complex subunit 1-like protein n=1 Tax=Leptotrombidium deliense TaxID=299467 RepID=A0A443S4A2_9ACAR|nr:activating signal cointegrator 1 complex subunit 1-like protein [Leptotrombidium deliense]